MAQPMINVLNYDMVLDSVSQEATNGDPESPLTQYRYIDLAKSLSCVNRKLYRSTRRYAVAGIQVIGTEGTSVSFFTAHDTYVTKNAVKKAFHMWQKMNKAVLADNPSLKPTWHDFKVYLDTTHRTQANNDLRPTPDFDYAPFAPGEWIRSQLVFPWTAADNLTTGAKESDLHIIGDHLMSDGSTQFNPALINSMGIIEAYKESRSTVQANDPAQGAVPDLHPYSGLFDHGDTNEDIGENIKSNNDDAPYAINYYPGDAQNPSLYNVSEIRVQSSEVVNMTNGFVAPCGLIKVATSQSSGILRLKVFLVPADNQYGVATEAII